MYACQDAPFALFQERPDVMRLRQAAEWGGAQQCVRNHDPVLILKHTL